MNVPILVLPTCRMCSRPAHPEEFIGNPQIGYCWRCYERHTKALDMLAGTTAFGCQECDRTVAELMAAQASDELKVRIYLKDGIYQILCVRCGDAYEQKRRDQFAGTPYGRARGIS